MIRRFAAVRSGILAALALVVCAPDGLTAQVSLQLSAGLRYSSALVRDSIVTPFDVRPALAPVVVVTLAAPLQHDWAPVVTVDFSTSTLTRHDADGSSTNLDRVSTLAFTVGVRRRLPAGFTVGAGAGGLKYLPSEDSGIFRQGSGALAGVGALTLGHVLPLGAGRHVGIEARYDLHPFITPALRAEGFDASRLVHRVALTVRTDWGATR